MIATGVVVTVLSFVTTTTAARFLLAGGTATVADIASVLHLSPGTVRNYLSAAIGKVGARNRAEAIRAAEEKGWL